MTNRVILHGLTHAALICLFLFAGTMAHARNVSMVTINWSPYFAENLEEGGFFTVLVREAFKAGGHDANIRFLPWKRAMNMVERTQSDVLMGAYFTEERDKQYFYSAPIFPVRLVLAANRRTGLTGYKDLRELSSYRIAVCLGWYYGEAFEKADYLKKEPALDQIINIRKLIGGRVDIVAGSEVVLRHEIDQRRDFSMKDVTILKPDLAREELYILTSRQLPDGKQLIEDFNRGMAIIRKNGMFDAILNRFKVSS
ncbi:substrate-binding periplasmic protein [Aestuariispira ectoiniformans]|uniref:substrate-binding periplasmic protein n=1 Tax=Aestuariispira ectoiniformans TaxID=2775080 RepID=UPI00223BFB83|nr:transporter substrate-binding domain-containing protein [Aestuariispira ectoiniformans]